MGKPLARREFLRKTAMGIGAATAAQAIPGISGAQTINRTDYNGPNIIIVRFGGGVRRLETIDPQHTYSPYFLKKLCPRGVLFNNMSIDRESLRFTAASSPFQQAYILRPSSRSRAGGAVPVSLSQAKHRGLADEFAGRTHTARETGRLGERKRHTQGRTDSQGAAGGGVRRDAESTGFADRRQTLGQRRA